MWAVEVKYLNRSGLSQAKLGPVRVFYLSDPDQDLPLAVFFLDGMNAWRNVHVICVLWPLCLISLIFDFLKKNFGFFHWFFFTGKYRRETTACRRKCHAADGDAAAVYLSSATDVENRFFETGVKHTLCLLKCRKEHFQGRHNPYTPDVDEAFEKLVPYDYLQVLNCVLCVVFPLASSFLKNLKKQIRRELYYSSGRKFIRS